MATTYPQDYPPAWGPRLIHHYLLGHAARLAEKPALVGVRTQWTYAELAEATGDFAAQLKSAGLLPGDRVLVELHPGPEAVALFCALSKAGLVYVPVSPMLPRSRIADIAETAEPRLHIHARSEDLAPAGGEIAVGRIEGKRLSIVGADFLARRPRLPARPVLETDLAYIIFTSGTTGRPKGIMMSHRAVLAFWRALNHHCALDDTSAVGTIAPLCFDFSILDMGCALGAGASLVFVPPLLPHQPAAFVDFLTTRGITQLNGVPSIWRPTITAGKSTLAQLSRLKAVFYAGEAFTVPEICRLQAALPDLRIINCFGQSESIACSFRDLENPLDPSLEKVPFAPGHPGVDLFLVDESGAAITEPGIVGELYLRGASLFSGYWKDPEGTARALVPDPLNPHNGDRVFKTGDLASRDGDGNFYFHGRRDQQVKILGNRVELEEIERQLGAHPAVGSACVAAIEGESGAELVAFVTLSNRGGTDIVGELRERCASRLPHYMMPSAFHIAAELPMTVNGKVDRQKLVGRYQREHTRAGEHPGKNEHAR